MLTLERRAELLLQTAELTDRQAYRAVATLLSALKIEDLIAEPELGCQLGHAWYRVDNFDQALELVTQLSEPCRRRGNDRVYRRRLNLEGTLLLEFGETAKAEGAFLEVFHRAIAVGDQHFVGYATLNLGAVASIRGEWTNALVALEHAMAAFQRLGGNYALAACHQNLAMTYREIGMLLQADSHFERSLELFHSIGSNVELDIASAEFERALAISASGDLPRAEATVRRSIDRIRRADSGPYPLTRHEGEALRVLGVVLLARRAMDEAKACLEQALQCSKAVKVRLLEAEVYEALSWWATTAGDIAESQRLAINAAEIYSQLGAKTRAERVFDPHRLISRI